MKRYLLSIFITIFLFGHNAISQDLKPQNVLVMDINNIGKRINKLISHVRIVLSSEFMFSDTVRSFRSIIDLLQLYIYEAQEMADMKVIERKGWMEELKKDGFIYVALIEIGSIRYSVGDTSFIGNIAKDSTLYIDESGEVHYVHSKIDDPFSLDLSLTFSGFGNYVLSLDRPPELLFLYDRMKDQYSALIGNRADVPEGIIGKDEYSSRRRIILTMKNIMITQRVDIETSGLELIAIYPYRLGRAAVQLFGLIGVGMLTILIFSFAMYFTFQSFKKTGVKTMEDEEKADVISEIDEELSGVEKKEKKPAPEPSAEAKEKDIASKRLEDDGIFIHE